jgi:hypothetical protein
VLRDRRLSVTRRGLIAGEVEIKPFLVLFAVAAVIAGGVYHSEISRYFGSLAGGSTYSSGSGSIQNMGSANKNLMEGIGGALRQ